MGKLSRTRLKILRVLQDLPQAEAINVKLRIRTEEAYKMELAKCFACRYLHDALMPSQAEIA